MDIESGNAGEVDTHDTGWFVGYGEWARKGRGARGLRYMNRNALSHSLCVKWRQHEKGDRKVGEVKPISEGRTLCVLAMEGGEFHIEFCRNREFKSGVIKRVLRKDGDFVIWGENLYHRGEVRGACTIVTVRWVPVRAADD